MPSHCHSGLSLRSCRREERLSSSVRGTQSPRSGGTEREAVSFSTDVNEEIDIYGRSDRAYKSGGLSRHGQGEQRERQRFLLHWLTATCCSKSTPTTSTRRSTPTEGEVGQRVLHQDSWLPRLPPPTVTPSSLPGCGSMEQQSFYKKVRNDGGETESEL